MNNPAQFDRATLAAVKPGVDATLGEFSAQLEAFLENVSDVAALNRAQSELHRLLGVFRMIRLDGVAVYCVELETLLSELGVTPQMTSALHREELRAATTMLVRYLDDLAQGADNTTLRLFANYQQMQQLRGLELSFELDLFFPNLSVQLPAAVLNLSRFPDPVAYFKAARNYYQQGLLRYLRHEDTPAALKLMQQAVNVALSSMPADGSRAFWWVCSGLIDCISRDGLPTDVNPQKIFGRIDQQMRSIIAGEAGNVQSLLNEMLYLIGRSHNVSEIVASIKQTYALDRYFPESTALSPVELAKRLGIIRELLRSTEEQWESCVRGDQAACANFASQARLIEQQNDKSDLNALQYLAQQISKFSTGAKSPDVVQRLGMDMAIALLLMGSGIAHYRDLDNNFQEQVRLLSERMQAEVDHLPLTDEQLSTLVSLYCQTERSDALLLLSKEMLINLQQVESGLNVLFADITRQDELVNVQRWLKQVQGGLNLSELLQASLLLEEIRETIQLFVETNKPIKPTDSRVVASALSQLEGYLEQLPNGHQDQVDGLVVAMRELQQLRQPAPVVVVQETPAEVVVARSSEDQELLEIFLEEAIEVLGIMRASLEACQISGSDANALVTIRRGFHTLKGSGRMVGLVDIGEVAWAAENAMNKWLQAAKPATALLLDFIDQTIQSFSGWVDALGSRGYAQVHAEPLMQLAQRIESIASGGTGEVETVVSAPPVPAPAPIPEVVVTTPSAPVAAKVEAVDSDHLHIGDRVMSLTLFKIGSEEAKQHVMQLRRCYEELREIPSLLVQYDFMRAAHTLAGVNRAMGFMEVVDLAFALEAWLQARIDTPSVLARNDLAMLEQTIASLEEMSSQVCEQKLPVSRDDLVLMLRSTRDVVSADVEPVVAAEEPTGLSDSNMDAFFDSLTPEKTTAATPPFEWSLTADTPQKEDTPVAEDVAVSMDSFFDSLVVSEESSPDLVQTTAEAQPLDLAIEPAVAIEPVVANEPAVANEQPAASAADALFAPIETASPVVQSTKFPALDFDFSLQTGREDAGVSPTVPEAATSEASRDELMSNALFNDLVPDSLLLAVDTPAQPSNFVPPTVELSATPSSMPVEPTLAKPAAKAAVEESVAAPVQKSNVVQVRDDVDEQLLPVFLEEADDLLPKMGAVLRAWRDAPNDERQVTAFKRLLHTIKGSSRMAGAMRIGEVAHDMESRVIAAEKLQQQPGYWDGLEHEFDRISVMLEQLRAGVVDEPEIVESDADSDVHIEEEVQSPEDNQSRRMTDRAAQVGSLLRVRADVVDLLVNEAGEISVARSRMESELQTFKEALLELTGSVNRLRQQLREVEIQAESQMQARINLSQTENEQFDPLEFDRFTRLQELTRFMNESVHDVHTVQQTLLKNLDETMAAISAQARLNRDLQQRLMNVRMVPFNSIAERLYRIMRQTGKDLRKRANLELQGGYIELDRSVLEKMTAPFEHLLRNAIAHGLEDESIRIQKGKATIGEIRLTLRQENNEVVFELSDDGGGLNFAALREKAALLGFSKPGDVLSEQQLSQLIFVSGISTASEVSAVAGRGIGMDVVRSEIAGLGGRIDVTSQSGLGTRFSIHLPLTLAVMQTVMVRSGESIFAIPATMIEQVVQVKTAEMAAIYAKGEIQVQERNYHLHALPVLLGDETHVAESHPRNSLLLLRSGEQRIALHVDELLGRHEAVVKNIGPQLARLIGVAGATVRGDGQVVLILNPVQMAQRVKSVVKKMPTAQPEPMRVQPIVMVVDDSLTVRKITSRLLTRAGYQVITATDGVNALEHLGDITPDVMLLDVEMPRMDGFELTKNIRRNAKMKQFPIIMITSRTANKHRDYAMQLGVNAYLGKPYQEDDLLRRIAEYVAAAAAVA